MSEKTSSESPILLPDGWSLERIDSLTRSNIKDFGSFSMTNLIEFVESGVPFIKSESVINGKIIFETIAFITEAVHRQLTKSFVFEGDILFTKIGAIGRVAVYDGRLGICNSNAATAKIQINSSKANSKFVAYQLSSERVMRKFARTIISTPPRINLGDINSMRIEFPSLPEQEKIAKILATIDRTITHTEALIEKYQHIKAGLMHDLFTRGIGADGKLRPTRDKAPELYQESSIGWIPNEWESIKLGKYIETNLYRPRFDARDYDENGNVKTIRGTDFSKDGDIKYSQVPVAFLPVEKINRHVLKTGDVIVVTTADCGLTAVFEEQEVNFIPSAYTVKYRFSDSVNPYFIKYFMQTNMAKTQVNKYIRQGTLGNLPGSDLLQFSISLPALHEQNLIVQRIDVIKSNLFFELGTLEKLIQQKSGLMHDLLTGIVQVNSDPV